MAVGEKYAFLQIADSASASPDTAGATVTIGASGAFPSSSARIVNAGTATLFVGLGTQSTSSASVTTKGMMIPPANNYGCVQVIRTGGNTKLAVFTVGATQTGKIYVTGGEGLAS